MFCVKRTCVKELLNDVAFFEIGAKNLLFKRCRIFDFLDRSIENDVSS